jgi:hypothetical protein
MADEEFETLLRAWGRIYGADRSNDAGRTPDPLQPVGHPIARAMEFAPGKKSGKRCTLSLERGGVERRRIMARAAGINGLLQIPAAMVDPVPCRATRPSLGMVSRPVPPEILRVERAALELIEADYLRGLCLRVNYCTRGDHEEKAVRVTDRMREVSPAFIEVKVRRFRDELEHARVWMQGRLGWKVLDIAS